MDNLTPAIALSYGNAGSVIRVRLPDGREIDALAANEINSTKLALAQTGNIAYAWSETSPQVVEERTTRLYKSRPTVEEVVRLLLTLLYQIEGEPDESINCACPTWVHHGDGTCISVCDSSGEYKTQAECETDYERLYFFDSSNFVCYPGFGKAGNGYGSMNECREDNKIIRQRIGYALFGKTITVNGHDWATGFSSTGGAYCTETTITSALVSSGITSALELERFSPYGEESRVGVSCRPKRPAGYDASSEYSFNYGNSEVIQTTRGEWSSVPATANPNWSPSDELYPGSTCRNTWINRQRNNENAYQRSYIKRIYKYTTVSGANEAQLEEFLNSNRAKFSQYFETNPNASGLTLKEGTNHTYETDLISVADFVGWCEPGEYSEEVPDLGDERPILPPDPIPIRSYFARSHNGKAETELLQLRKDEISGLVTGRSKSQTFITFKLGREVEEVDGENREYYCKLKRFILNPALEIVEVQERLRPNPLPESDDPAQEFANLYEMYPSQEYLDAHLDNPCDYDLAHGDTYVLLKQALGLEFVGIEREEQTGTRSGLSRSELPDGGDWWGERIKTEDIEGEIYEISTSKDEDGNCQVKQGRKLGKIKVKKLLDAESDINLQNVDVLKVIS